MSNPLIRFDWAMKRLRRQKSTFVILQGFLSALLTAQAFITINVQNSRLLAYFQRMFYGVSNTMTEQLTLGEPGKKSFRSILFISTWGKTKDEVNSLYP